MSSTGYVQGELAGKKLSKKFTHIDRVITTPMIRTHQTAMKILEAFPLTQSIFTEDNGQIVLAVTHSGTMRSIYWHLTQDLGFFCSL